LSTEAGERLELGECRGSSWRGLPLRLPQWRPLCPRRAGPTTCGCAPGVCGRLRRGLCGRVRRHIG
jgi:hypothetical protein